MERKYFHRKRRTSNTQYSFSTRFEDGIGPNHEELIAAAHAGCFSMALSDNWQCRKYGGSIETTATSYPGKTEAGLRITEVHLT